MGCFQVKSRAEILHQKRKRVPFPPPINRFDLHAPGVGKFRSKDSQKNSIHPQNSSFSVVYLFAVQATTFIIVSFSATISTTGSQHSHRPATATAGALPLQIFFFFLPVTATTICTTLSSTVVRTTTSQPSPPSSSSSSSSSQQVTAWTVDVNSCMNNGVDYNSGWFVT